MSLSLYNDYTLYISLCTIYYYIKGYILYINMYISYNVYNLYNQIIYGMQYYRKIYHQTMYN